jgi:hypothetical protein
VSGGTQIIGSGSTGTTLSLFSVDGASGRLFDVTDDFTNSLFSVNTSSGVPVIEAFANNSIVMGTYGSNALVVSGRSTYFGVIPSDSNYRIISSGATLFSGGTMVIKGSGTTSGSTALSVQNSSGGTLMNLFDNGNLNIDNGALFVNGNNGRVGISTSNPQYLLTNTSSTAPTGYNGSHTLDPNGLYWKNPSNLNDRYIAVFENTSSYGNGILIKGSSLSHSNFEIIDENSTKLFYIGDSLISSTIGAFVATTSILNLSNCYTGAGYGRISVGTTNAVQGLETFLYSNTSSERAITFRNNGGGQLAAISSSVDDLNFYTRTSGTFTSSDIRMKIAPTSGNVLIGTTTDSGFKLNVNGTSNFSGNMTLGGTATLGSTVIGSSGIAIGDGSSRGSWTLGVGYVVNMSNVSNSLGVGSVVPWMNNSISLGAGAYADVTSSQMIMVPMAMSATTMSSGSTAELYISNNTQSRLSIPNASVINAMVTVDYIATCTLTGSSSSLVYNDVKAGTQKFYIKKWFIHTVGSYFTISEPVDVYSQSDSAMSGATLSYEYVSASTFKVKFNAPPTANGSTFVCAATARITTYKASI